MAKYLDLNGLGIIAGKFKEIQPGKDGQDGKDGATYTPAVSSDGTLTWTNDQNLPNPDPVNIRGPQGPRGATGATGPQGEQGAIIYSNNGGTPLICAYDANSLLSALLTLSTEMYNQYQIGEYPQWEYYMGADSHAEWSPMWHIYFDSAGIYNEMGQSVEHTVNGVFDTLGAEMDFAPITAALITVSLHFTADGHDTPNETLLLDVLVRPVSYIGASSAGGAKDFLDSIEGQHDQQPVEYYLFTLLRDPDGGLTCLSRWRMPWEQY